MCPALVQTFPVPFSRKGQCAKMGSTEGSLVMSRDDTEKIQSSETRDSEYLSDLIDRSREGDSGAMEALYTHFKISLFNLAYRYTYNTAAAEDLLQEVFIKVFTQLHTVKTNSTFVGWMYRIAVNTCLSYLRSQKKWIQRNVPLDDVEAVLKSDASDSSESDLTAPLERAIQSLPNRLKSVFILHDVQGFKHHEVSQMLGCSVGTSKSHLFKARAKIRRYLTSLDIL